MLRILLLLAILGTLASGLGSCARYAIDPSAGEETVFLRTLDHTDKVELQYLRTPEQGPISYRHTAWMVLWGIPLNHPDVGLWISENLPEGTEAANFRAHVTTPWYGPFVLFPTLGFFRVDTITYRFDPVVVKPVAREVFPPVPPRLSVPDPAPLPEPEPTS